MSKKLVKNFINLFDDNNISINIQSCKKIRNKVKNVKIQKSDQTGD